MVDWVGASVLELRIGVWDQSPGKLIGFANKAENELGDRVYTSLVPVGYNILWRPGPY